MRIFFSPFFIKYGFCCCCAPSLSEILLRILCCCCCWYYFIYFYSSGMTMDGPFWQQQIHYFSITLSYCRMNWSLHNEIQHNISKKRWARFLFARIIPFHRCLPVIESIERVETYMCVVCVMCISWIVSMIRFIVSNQRPFSIHPVDFSFILISFQTLIWCTHILQ